MKVVTRYFRDFCLAVTDSILSVIIFIVMEQNEEKTVASNTESEKDTLLKRMKPKVLKDILLYVSLALVIVAISLSAFFLKPSSENSHVEIKYGNTLLYDPNDSSKKTAIAFPSSGEKRITFTNDDGPKYLGEGNNFSFIDGSITLTIYSDKSIQIKEEDVFCQDHLCSHMGRIYSSYTPVVCLPNHFSAMIVADGLPDYDA